MTDDDQLRRLLSDAVSDIEPQDRLPQIRDSVRSDPKVVPMSRPRSWIAVVGVAAAVAVIGGVAFAAGALQGNNNADDPGPAGNTGLPTRSPQSLPTSTSTDLPTPTSPTGTPTNQPQWRAAGIYYVGDGPKGPVLFREFQAVPPSTPPLDAAVQGVLTLPTDPDYRTDWQAGWITSASQTGDVIDVVVGSQAPHGRPASMSAAEAGAAVQQVIYSVQAAVEKRLPVQFVSAGGNPVDQVLGVPTSEPLAQGKVLTTLSLMSISNPYDGFHAKRGTLVVDGANNGFEGTVVLKLMQGDTVVLQRAGIGGSGLTKLYPWKITLDTSKVPAGKYTLVATNDDPSGHGNPDTDTRTVYLK